MDSHAQKKNEILKVVYTDHGTDYAITGKLISEDDFFVTIEARTGVIYRLGKRTIVAIKPYQPGVRDR